jgi:hypothetical protein
LRAISPLATKPGSNIIDIGSRNARKLRWFPFILSQRQIAQRKTANKKTVQPDDGKRVCLLILKRAI